MIIVSKLKQRFFQIMGDRHSDIFPLGTIFFCDFNTYHEQSLNCMFNVRATRTMHDYFIIVTHTLHLSAKNISSCAVVIRDRYYLPSFSHLRFLFTNELSTSGIVVLCSDKKFTNVSHEKIEIKIEVVIFFRKKIQSKSIKIKKSRIVTTLSIIDVCILQVDSRRSTAF